MFGGTKIAGDERALRTNEPIDLIIATPGRLQDHLNQNTAGPRERILRCPFGFPS